MLIDKYLYLDSLNWIMPGFGTAFLMMNGFSLVFSSLSTSSDSITSTEIVHSIAHSLKFKNAHQLNWKSKLKKQRSENKSKRKCLLKINIYFRPPMQFKIIYKLSHFTKHQAKYSSTLEYRINCTLLYHFGSVVRMSTIILIWQCQ